MTSKLTIIWILILVCFSNAFSQSKEIDSLKQILNTSRNDIEKSQILNQLADSYKSHNPQMVLDYASQALALSEKIKNRLEQAQANVNLGNAQIILGNYPKALEYFTSAKNLYEEL